jgi:hypothetical protein
MVEHSTQNPEVEGSKPPLALGERKMGKKLMHLVWVSSSLVLKYVDAWHNK